MRTLVSDKYRYLGFDNGNYRFEDPYGSILLVDEAKFIVSHNNKVYFMHESSDRPKIELSFSTARRLGLSNIKILNESLLF
jgi:hypothetical protein